MKGGKQLFFEPGPPALSVNYLPERLRRVTALICVFLFFQVIYLPLQARPSGKQIQPLKRVIPLERKVVTRTLDFSITGKAEADFSLTIGAAGKITASASWTGTASSLALILNGPGQTQYYARRDGQSPLVLEFEITQELLAKGNNWKLSLVSFQTGITASGKITLQLPAGSSVVQLSGQPSASAQDKTISTETQAQPKTTAQTAATEKTSTAASRTGVAATKPSLKDLLGGRKKVTKPEIQTAEVEEDLSDLQKRLESGIQKISQETPMGGIIVPLFFKYLEELADNQELVRSFYQYSEHKKSLTETDLTNLLQRPVRAYKQIPREFKARYLSPAFVDLKKGDRVEIKQLGREVVQRLNPDLEPQVKQIVRESFSGRYMLTREQILAGQKIAPVAGLSKFSGQQKAIRAQVQTARPVSQAVSACLARLSDRPSETELSSLKEVLNREGVQIPAVLTRGSLVNDLTHVDISGDSLRRIDQDMFGTGYYWNIVTLDWLRCLDKNERSEDEPYAGVLINRPQFDPSDLAYAKFLKDGCLYYTYSHVTRTYDVEKNKNYGFKGDDRIIISWLDFNTPFSFTIDLWEHDYSKKGSFGDALRSAALHIMQSLQRDIKAAVMSQIMSYIADAILSSSGVNKTAALQLIDQILTGNLSFVDFQNLLFNLFSGRAVDVSWYMLYFLFSGCDLMETVAMIGGGSTVVGALILTLAIVGPILEDAVSSFSSGEVGTGFLDLLKVLSAFPGYDFLGLSMVFGPIFDLLKMIGLHLTLTDFAKRIFTELRDFIYSILAIIDPDDHLGQKTITVLPVSGNWHNDAKDGEWKTENLMGAVACDEAEANFARHGYGPTYANSTLIENNHFWVPGFTIKGGDAKYQIYYEVHRELAGGRYTHGFYFPETPALNAKKLTYSNFRLAQSSASAETPAETPAINVPKLPWPFHSVKRFRVGVLSVNTQGTPLVSVTDKKNGRIYTNLVTDKDTCDLLNVFEFEAEPGSEFEILVIKLGRGEMAGYVSIWEMPKTDVVRCPEPVPGTGVPASGGGSNRPTKQQQK